MNKPCSERIETAVRLSYLDGELATDEAAAIERVRAESEAVQRRLDAIRVLRRALAAPVLSLESRKVDLDLEADACDD